MTIQDPFEKNGWHQCVRCGCTFPDEFLKRQHRKDTTLNINESVRICVDAERCTRFKTQREDELRREHSQLLLDIATAPIKPVRLDGSKPWHRFFNADGTPKKEPS